ncbi:MarR family winged helix-turn-helix transcriptional regulator [Nitrospirillum viridazoti]|uniref:DNA-binding MarR family transcriptional regulator n=2 Tax=Nitrospirillum TaxID=1543705 RepID=A0A560IYH0_9PROT|nr:MarR family transcriptional regulator [Nitrospirillum amazonense]TWB63515.1 DNA-binding MarR family transcriptional regulator [Nitrospirillum amazonense]
MPPSDEITPPEDYSRRLGGAALGARLRRLSETIDGDATRTYDTLGVTFEQRWFGVLNQLVLNGPLTVGELAGHLRITHVSVSQTRASLEKAGLARTTADPDDARRRRLALTPAGMALVDTLRPLWRALETAALELDAEAQAVTAALDRLEDALARRSLYQRVLDHLGDDHPGDETA